MARRLSTRRAAQLRLGIQAARWVASGEYFAARAYYATEANNQVAQYGRRVHPGPTAHHWSMARAKVALTAARYREQCRKSGPVTLAAYQVTLDRERTRNQPHPPVHPNCRCTTTPEV